MEFFFFFYTYLTCILLPSPWRCLLVYHLASLRNSSTVLIIDQPVPCFLGRISQLQQSPYLELDKGTIRLPCELQDADQHPRPQPT